MRTFCTVAALLASAVLFLVVRPEPVAGQAQPQCIACGGGGGGGGIIVSPRDGTELTGVHANSSGNTAVFLAENPSSSPVNNITLTCSATGNLSCQSVSPSVYSFDAHEIAEITVTYSTGMPAQDTLRLSPSSGTSGEYLVDVLGDPPIVTLVTPAITSGSRAVVASRAPRIIARFRQGTSAIDTTRTVLVWKGDTVTKWRADTLTMPRHNRGVLEWEPDSVRGLNAATAADSTQLQLRVCGTDQICTTVTRWVVLQGDASPVLSFSSLAPNAWGGGTSIPLGPGIATSGPEVETGFSTVPYFAMNGARSTGLVYSTRQSYPRVLVPIDVELRSAGAPSYLVVRLFDGAVKLDSLRVSNPSCLTGSAKRCRAVLQGDFSGSTFSVPTRKWLKVEAQESGSGATSVDSVEVVLVDRRQTRFGSGWWPSALATTVSAGDDRLLVAANGAATVLRGVGDSVYLPAPGSFVALRKSAAGWELRASGDSGVTRFDSYGRLVAVQDPNGNKDSLTYGGTSDSLLQLRDPTGHTITFTYSSNKLSYLTDAAGRQTRVTIDGSNRLVYDSISSPTARPYTTTFVYQSYPGTSSFVLAKRIGVVLDTTIIVYDSTFRRRPVQALLPKVQTPAGSDTKPAIGYAAMERRGYGALVSLDSVYTQVTDPLGNWTRTLSTRHRSLAWDAMGVLGRARFAADGRMLWSEAKIPGDTTRVYYGYDPQLRPVKSWIVRVESGGSILRSDSLVYDGNNRVVKRVDPRGQADSAVYSSKGNLIATRDKAGNWTYMGYRSADGQLDTLRLPGDTVSYRFTYDATWKHRLRVVRGTTPGILLDTLVFDSVGRASMQFDRVRSRKDSMAWRRTTTYYNAANQVDSVVNLKSGNCLPCNDPPGSGYSLEQRVGKRYDRAGRDSVRLNATGKATVYLYDGLGRLIKRTPPAGGSPPSDVWVYDVAGNLVKTVTRRGDTITTNYDSRNRDTLSVVPGVGTLRRSYGGPLDQLTRVWIQSPVDSIGNVNAAVAYVYDKRGRLTADSSWTGSTARVTSYTLDVYERDSTRVDPVGTWKVRYDAVRGYPNRVVTPFGDSLDYQLDAQGRATLAPKVRSSGPDVTRSLGLSATSGSLTVLSNTVGSWNAGTFDPEPASENGESAPLAPVWTEQHGSGAAVDSITDGSQTDSWGRLTGWTQSKNGSSVAASTYSFDSTGNVSIDYPATFDGTTDRLSTRLDLATGYSWNYSYDLAGNQTQAVGTKSGQPTHTWTYGYDALGQLRSVRYDGTLIARYEYDVLGRRVAKRVYSSGTGGTVGYRRFVYSGDQVAFETDSAGTIKTKYTWGADIDDLVALTDSSGTTYYAVQDQVRSLRGLLRRDGMWMQSQRFTPYGSLLARDTTAAPQPSLRYGWTGREFDPETGLYFMRARYLSPSQGRFTQEDPIGFAGGSNLYSYASGAVLGARDPSGLECVGLNGGPVTSGPGFLPELDPCANRDHRFNGGWGGDDRPGHNPTPGEVLEELLGLNNGTIHCTVPTGCHGQPIGSGRAAKQLPSTQETDREVNWTACTYAAISAGVTVYLDFTGLGAIGKTVVLGVRGGWRFLSANRIIGLGRELGDNALRAVGGHFRSNAREMLAQAGSTAAEVGRDALDGGVFTTPLSLVAGMADGDVNWKHLAAGFVPIVASVVAINDAVKACTPK